MGADFDALGDKKDEVLAENQQRAEQRVRSSLVLEKIGEAEGIEIGESEFFDYLEKAAAEQGSDPDRFVSNVHKKGLEEYYRRLALEDKVLGFLLERTTVNEKGKTGVSPEAKTEEE